MLRINQLKINIHHTEEELINKLCKKAGIGIKQLISYTIVRQSIDARNKNDIRYSYTIDIEVKDENKVRSPEFLHVTAPVYSIPESGSEYLKDRPVIVGCGPAGLFCALTLTKAGYKPVVIERGERVEDRINTVNRFWNDGILDTESNVSFGEGGAGTFSDGKLNTLVKDDQGRNFEVLRTFVEFGADSEILYQQKPHVGTDRLVEIISGMRNEILSNGGEILFKSKLTDIFIEDGRVKSIEINGNRRIDSQVVVLALGHSARDTFEMLNKKKIPMSPKAFAIGLRIQHPQSMIDISQFGMKEAQFLSPASYKLTEKASNGRGVYSFCMCPGGYVVDASTEECCKTVNGMSYHGRASGNANSAIVVQVVPDDFSSDDPLAGVEYQRKLEKAAYIAGNTAIPVQLLGDFVNGKSSETYGDVIPCFKGNTTFARLDQVLPDYVSKAIVEVMPAFESKIKGFGRYDAILAGLESRTSSPLRIERNNNCVSSVDGIYPCGEGAGYAGGITSAAMDGLRVAESIIKRYKRL